MGRSKPLLPWNGTTLIKHQVRSLRQGGCSEVVVVLGHQSDELSGELGGMDVILAENTDYETGRISSIKCGVKTASSEADCYVLLGVDQPRHFSIVGTLIKSHVRTESLITSPRFEEKGGHPVIFSSKLRKDILALEEGDGGLRKVFNEYRDVVNEVKFSGPEIHLDLNTLEEYQTALSQYSR
tara:strand:+ start:3248 stop:3796 length:549 start_codon:yes stop_codon:yes gene_type:complete